MDLQNQQLTQLTEWLAKTEERTKKVESEPLGPDLEDLKRQIEEHKVFMQVIVFMPVIVFYHWSQIMVFKMNKTHYFSLL